MVFMTRGAAVEKMMDKSSDFLENSMTIMKNKYNINTARNLANRPLGAKMTLPRIVASSPITVVRLFVRGIGRSIVDPTVVFPGVDLLKAVLAPMITSVLPDLMHLRLFSWPWLFALMMCYIIWGRRLLLYRYFLAAYNSNAVPDESKALECVRWGIMEIKRPVREGVEGEIVYIKGLLDLVPVAKEVIRSSRAGDPHLEDVLSRL